MVLSLEPRPQAPAALTGLCVDNRAGAALSRGVQAADPPCAQGMAIPRQLWLTGHLTMFVTAEPESEISVAMGSSSTVPFPVVWGLVLLAMYCTT